MARILVVDDEASILAVFSSLLKAQGHEVDTAGDGHKALELLDGAEYNVMVSDMRMSPMNGMELLKLAHEKCPKTAIVMLTAYSSVETAIESLKFGAFDYCTKPFKVDEFLDVLERALKYNKALTQQDSSEPEPDVTYYFGNIVAESPQMQAVCHEIKKMAAADTPVLICGEAGTGKELVARTVHSCSRRSDKEFHSINCAELPEPMLEVALFGDAQSRSDGLLVKAEGGTVFLDEIGGMPMGIQEKLVSVLQDRKVMPVGGSERVDIDVRFFGASNSDAQQLVSEGFFRDDLCQRLCSLTISIPPLRARKEDILPVTRALIQQCTEEGKEPPVLDPDVAAIFESYSWPGNVKEIHTVLEEIWAHAPTDKITKDMLPQRLAEIKVTASKSGTADDIEKQRGQSLRTFLKMKATGAGLNFKKS